jgi:hypothetical protein
MIPDKNRAKGVPKAGSGPFSLRWYENGSRGIFRRVSDLFSQKIVVGCGHYSKSPISTGDLRWVFVHSFVL